MNAKGTHFGVLNVTRSAARVVIGANATIIQDVAPVPMDGLAIAVALPPLPMTSGNSTLLVPV